MPVWDPEVEVDVDLARSLIDAQFPVLAGRPIRELGAGWDNVVYLVDERWTFRFPRREIAVAGVRREIDILPRLAQHLALPIPVPHFVGVPTEAFTWPWFGAEHIAGTEVAVAGPHDEERAELGQQIGEFLRDLHDPGLARRVGDGLPVDPMRRADMPFRVDATRRRLEELSAARLWEPTAETDALLHDAAGLPPSPRTVVVHGDLHARHVLVDPAARATGVIDWGDVCAGDPSVDLSLAFGAFVGEARAAFFDAYGQIDGLTELRARVIAVFVAAALLAYADDQRLAPLRADSLRSLERAIA